MISFKAVLGPLALGLVLVGASANPQVKQDKKAALASPTCVLPMGQTIDAKDLPHQVLLRDWMKPLDDNLPLSLVSIPATHDAGTARGLTGWTRCQSLTIPAQLAIGVRGFDIRLRLVDRELLTYHGEESQTLMFADILKAFQTFLTQHPQEFLVVRVREESNSIRAQETFEAAFARYIAPPELNRLFYRAKSRTEIPAVKEVRGKIVLLDNYGKLPEAIDYPNPTMAVQDDYDTSDLDNKYNEVVAKFQDALDQRDGAVWNVNYVSSSTVQVDQLANATTLDPKVNAFLQAKHGHLGLVFLNFLGPVITRQIVESNF